MTLTAEELQQKLEQNRVPVQQLELDKPLGYVYDEAGVVTWNNLGVVVMCRQRTNGKVYVVDLQIYSKDSGWSRITHRIVRKYRLKKVLANFAKQAQYIAELRAAGWTFQGCKDEKVELVVVNPIDQTEHRCSRIKALSVLKKLSASPVQAILQNKAPAVALLPEAVYQAIQLAGANQYQTEVSLMAARHHDMSDLLERVNNAQVQDGQSLLAAVEQAHSKALNSAS